MSFLRRPPDELKRPWIKVPAGSYLRFPHASTRKRFLAVCKLRLRYQDKPDISFTHLM